MPLIGFELTQASTDDKLDVLTTVPGLADSFTYHSFKAARRNSYLFNK